ncbi:hypothetical protein AB0H88_39995 [Nonomuraea sp. NPDC050680]|uniref:hypothetical protein n=1 Tax=Nonomuraea sp. NPDC050680 TaxID=3154630 RepID=UPI0033DEDDC5
MVQGRVVGVEAEAVGHPVAWLLFAILVVAAGVFVLAAVLGGVDLPRKRSIF